MVEPMNWNNLMSNKRFLGPDQDPKEDTLPEFRSPFLKDADRIIYSAAFRRLQDKTQVHPFPETDYVRTRLTHSLEVSSVGRALGMGVGNYVVKKHKLGNVAESDFGAVVAAACLAHDIGNPPFGHPGEDAIRDWFCRGEGNRLLNSDAALTEAEQKDLQNFEGNAQGFRILTRLQGWREKGGLRLSCATLGAFTKYPYDCMFKKLGKAKFGYFQRDRESFGKIANILGLLQKKEGAWCRHPLAFLVEAADDICYLVVDVEDGFKAKRIGFDDAEGCLKQIADGYLTRYSELDTESDKIAYLRAKAIGVLVDEVIRAFRDNDEEMLRGVFDGSLLEYIPQRQSLEEIRKICDEKIFRHERRLEQEAAGFQVIQGLLGIYSAALKEWECCGRKVEAMPPKEQTIMRLLPEEFKMLPGTRYQRLLRLVDYVSGMTDNFAVRRYRDLMGMNAGRIIR